MKDVKPLALEGKDESFQMLCSLWNSQNSQLNMVSDYIQKNRNISPDILRFLEKSMAEQVTAFEELLEVQKGLSEKLYVTQIPEHRAIMRFEVTVKEIPLAEGEREVANKAILIGGEAGTVSDAVEQYFKKMQCSVIRLPHFASKEEQEQFLSQYDYDYAGMVVVLTPQSRYEDFLNAFYNLSWMAGYLDKQKSAEPFVIGITTQDGAFGLTGNHRNVVQGGLSGIIKTFAKEHRKGCYVKLLDFAPGLSESTYEKYFKEELNAGDSYVEVARDQNGKRYTFVYEEHYDEVKAHTEPNRQDVFVVSGGGRGITAECILALSKQYGGNYIILGRTSIEDDLYPECTVRSELIEKVAAQAKKDGVKMKLPEIARKADQIIFKREIRENIKHLESNGAKVVYCSCNILDQNDVKDKIRNAEKITGPVTGIIHGAGVLRDKKLSEKTEQDFTLVYDTKVKGIESILGAVDVSMLRYISFFSSVAGCLGNVGQADYAAANEYLNKLAYALKKENPNCMVMAMNWGPWDGGMVDESLKENMRKRGRTLISKEVGIQYFLEQFSRQHGEHVCQSIIFDYAP